MDNHIAVPVAAATVAAASTLDASSGGVFVGYPLLGVCALGSVIGACVALGFWLPTREAKHPARMLLKFGASLGCGVFMTPGLMRWQNVPLAADYVALCSVVVAAFAVIALHLLLPVLELYVERFGRRHPGAVHAWEKLTRPADLLELRDLEHQDESEEDTPPPRRVRRGPWR